MSRLLAIPCLAVASVLSASGPYAPVRVSPRPAAFAPQDDLYNAGKALYGGAVKLGSGSSCSSCHAGAAALNRGRLAKLTRQDLPGRIDNCVKAADRGNASVQGNQLDALTHYLTKRFRL